MMNNYSYRKTLLVSASEIKTNSIVSMNVDDSFISATVLNAQEIYLSTLIGTALYFKLQELVYNKIQNKTPNIYDDEHLIYNECLQEYVKPVIKSRVMIDLLYNMSFKLRNAGVIRSSDTNVSYSTIEEIKYLEKQYSVAYNHYCDKLSKFLYANTNSMGELLENTPLYYDKPNMNKDYASDGGLWLGGSKKKTCDCL